MDVRKLDEMQAQNRSIFDTDLAVAYYARVSTDKDEQMTVSAIRNTTLRTTSPKIRTGRSPAAMSMRASAARRSRDASSFSR